VPSFHQSDENGATSTDPSTTSVLPPRCQRELSQTRQTYTPAVWASDFESKTNYEAFFANK